jgi:hypothetical protein
MWLDALPAELVATSASLSAARVWVALDTGRLEEVGAALDAAEISVPPDTQLMVLRALQLYKAGDVGGAAARAEDDGNRLAYIYAEGCRALLAVNRGDLVLADSLGVAAESAVGQALSDSHFVAMFPALARAWLGIERADWTGARQAAGLAVELGRRGAGRVELAAALLTAAKASRIGPDAHDRGVDPGALMGEARDQAAGAAAVGPLRDLGPALDRVGPMPYTAFQAILDPFAPRGFRSYARGEYPPALTGAAIGEFLAHAAALATAGAPLSQMVIFRIGQGIAAIPDDATAFSHRDARYLFRLNQNIQPRRRSPCTYDPGSRCNRCCLSRTMF